MWEKLCAFSVFIRNYLMDGFAIFFFSGKGRSNNRKSVLVIRLDAIGDFILWLDAAAELRKIYQSEYYRLILIGNCIWTELAEIQQIFDEVIPFDRHLFNYKFKYRLKIWKLLRGTEWNVVINPTYSRELLFGDSVVRICNAREKIGSKGDLSNHPAWQSFISDKWYTKLLPASNMPLMELERNAEFIRSLGRPYFQARLPELISINKLPSELLDVDYLVVVPGTSLVLHQWPVEKFAELITLVKQKYEFKVVICGAPNEIELGSRLRQLIHGNVIDYIGKTSLVEYVSIIKRARLLIGNDSSAVHIAAALGVKAISLLGGMHFGRFLPYSLEQDTELARPLPAAISHQMECFRCNNKCIYVAQNDGCSAPCLEQISVTEVLNEITLYLSKPGC